ncbi:Phospholipid scramblase [Sergentomyia squamirostris]
MKPEKGLASIETTAVDQNVVIAQPRLPGPGTLGFEIWTTPQLPIINCPPGLEPLLNIELLTVLQHRFSVFDKNRYVIRNAVNQEILWAEEAPPPDSCFGARRFFDMQIMDIQQREVMTVFQSYDGSCCGLPMLRNKMDICAPPGNPISYVEQRMSGLRLRIVVKDAAGNPVLNIHAPSMSFKIGGDLEFSVLQLDGQVIGKIVKKWSRSGLFTPRDMYVVTFPPNIDVSIKTALVGACFLLDLLMYSSEN